MRQEDLDAVSQTYETIKELKSTMNKDADKVMTTKLEVHRKAVIAELNEACDGVDDPFVRHALVMRGKEQLFDICFTDVIEMTNGVYPELGHALEKIRRVHATLLGDLPALVRGVSQHYMQDIAEVRAQCERSDKETTQLLEAAEMLEQEARTHVEEKKAMHAEFERERAMLINELKKLSQENEAYLARLGGKGGKGGKAAGGGTPASSVSSRRPDSAGPALRTPGGAAPNNASLNASRASNQSASSSAAGQQRVLSLRQLKELIQDVYDSKVKFDKKCAAAHLPRETLEQHLYTYLNQRYGLKSLIIEWASAIIAAIKKFSATDNDVAVFGAILRNEVDEEFRLVQKQLKETVRDLLRVYLKGKFPLKSEAEIGRLIKERQKGELEEEEWTDIVKYMYNDEDSVTLITRVKDVIRELAAERERNEPQHARARQPRGLIVKRPTPRVTYQAFLKTLLDFQLQGHEVFLAKFIRTFRRVDADKNGIVNEAEFRDLVTSLRPDKTEHDLMVLLNVADPYNNQQITFSEAVSVLSTELVQIMAETNAEAPVA